MARKIIGDEYFQTATCVILMDKTITKSDLDQVAQLPELICVNLYDAQIVDEAGMKRPI